MTQLRFGIVGCGNAAVPVCEAIQASPLAEIAVACDLNPELARDIGLRYGAAHTDQAATVWSDPDVDAAYIAVPHDQLARLAGQALAAGKHALVEKPMALTLTDADELIAAAEAGGLTLGAFYEMRYAPAFEQARELIQAGAIGRVIGLRIEVLIDKPESYWQAGWLGRSSGPWRGQKAHAGGGVLMMNASHFLDAAWYMTGLEVTSVTGESDTLVAPVEVEDTVAATLRFDNGAVGGLYAGAHLAGSKAAERCEIYGTEGTLLVPDPYVGGDLQVYLRRGWRDLPAGAWTSLPGAPGPVYSRAVDEFAQAALRRAPAPIGGRDARRVLATVLGIYQSAAERRAIRL